MLKGFNETPLSYRCDIMTDETPTIIQQINEPRYVLEVKHMKSGSSLVLSISKLRVSGDNLEDVMNDLNSALSDYLGITGDDSS
tara:strand:+ start:3088 stop:3339 length:252 start_codon:yes stop_codon:yes gene_type:complete